VDTLHTGQNGAVASQDGGLTLAEAASRLGVAPRTVRRRIQREEIVAELVQGDHGAEYRVWLDEAWS
jgi:DNA-directed RNA polymerase specialized sigma24 family protein